MIKLFADSASDMTKEEATKYGVEIIPLKVRFGNDEYIDGVTITPTEFFEKLIESDELPKTSQLTPYDFDEVFSKLDKEDEIIVITISSKLSGTYQNAKLMESEYPNIHVIDSNNVTVGEKVLVIRARELIDQGKDIKDIISILEEEKKNIRLVALLDTLKYLKKGGRISATTALIGEVLSIKPVVEIVDGKVVSTGKARGSKNGNNKLREAIAKYNGIDFSRPVELAYSGLSDAMLKKYVVDCKDIYGDRTLNYSIIGSVIGTHIGPGAIAVAFFNNK